MERFLKLSDCCKEFTKIYEYCEYYLDYMEIRNKYFVSDSLKFKKDSNITRILHTQILTHF